MIKKIFKRKYQTKSVIVIIPIYKAQPTEAELAAFNQCLKVLSLYPICIISHSEVDLSIYERSTNNQTNIKYFPSHYFSSIDGYSELLREQQFYLAFKDYDYMLIYQLDAWVFKDELMEWCNKGYDYIGAPWFENFGSHETGKKLWAVGNGGFSLRKIKTFIKLTHPKRRMMNTFDVFRNEYQKIKDIPSCILHSFGHRNSIEYYRNFYYNINEDVYFCVEMQKYSNMRLYFPSPEEASEFSFERSPRYLYERNGGKLPFGCHAWEKYDKQFWMEFIQI